MNNAPPLIVTLPPGDAGTLHTLAAMRVAADRLANTAAIRALAARIAPLSQIGYDPDQYRTAAAIFYYMQQSYTFAPDPSAAELQRDHLAQVAALLDFPRTPALGDCDDRAVITAALCQACHIGTRFVLVSAEPRRRWHHVYTEARTRYAITAPPAWTALDSQVCAEPGIEPPRIVRRYTEGDPEPAELF